MRPELDQNTIEQFETEGVTVLRGVFSDWVDVLRKGVAANMADPNPEARSYRDKDDGGPKTISLWIPLNEQTRVYETNAYLPYHTDPSDVVGLLCLQQAKNGGLSSLVSTASVYNELVQHYPEFLALYYQPFFMAHLGTKEPTPNSIFSFNEGKLSCRFLRQYLELGHEMMKQPLSRIEVEAIALMVENA